MRKCTRSCSRQISVRKRLSRVDRCGEADAQRAQAYGVARTGVAHDREAGDAIGGEAVQDRPVEARGARGRRVGVQWIAIGEQPVEQREIGTGAEVVGEIGCTLRHFRQCGGAEDRPGGPCSLKPPSARQTVTWSIVAISAPDVPVQ